MAAQHDSQCESQHYDVGVTIDERYHLVEFIGSGGMACVYRAEEEGTPHEFALKFLKSEYHNLPYLITYFEDEASSMRDLAHPNIVRFYRFVNRDDYSYILMDYVNGFSLSDVITNQSEFMPVDEVVRIMVQIARAIDAIHRENFVHRDIKPGNVLIDRSTGQAFLTDLGITSSINTRIEGAGTMAYMSPEQAETWIADQRSDIYAYGVMLYEMLTLKRPYVAPAGMTGELGEAEIIRQHKEAPIPKITDAREDLPKELNGIIAKALAKDPDDRYQTILDFASDVHQALLLSLPDDLLEFSDIQHRQFDTPVREPIEVIQKPPRMILALVVAVAILIGLLFLNTAINNTAPVIPTATNTALPTATHTNTPMPTPTDNPLEGLPIAPFLNDAEALSAGLDGETLLITPSEDSVLQYLRVGLINGFRVEMDIVSTVQVNRFGLAFRMQDAANYHLFTINPVTLEWEIARIIDDSSNVQDSGQFEALPTRLIISGYNDFFEIRAADSVITYETGVFPMGSLAIYLDEGELLLERLQVSLMGEEAFSAVETTPTPSIGLFDPFRLIRADVNAILDTNSPISSEVDCPVYIEVYDTLERHLENRNEEVRTLAESAIDVGALMYSRCRSESPDEPLSFIGSVQDYIQWETDLRAIQDDLNSR